MTLALDYLTEYHHEDSDYNFVHSVSFSIVSFILLCLIFHTTWCQGLLVYGRQGQEIFRSNLDLNVCREVTFSAYVTQWPTYISQNLSFFFFSSFTLMRKRKRFWSISLSYASFLHNNKIEDSKIQIIWLLIQVIHSCHWMKEIIVFFNI